MCYYLQTGKFKLAISSEIWQLIRVKTAVQTKLPEYEELAKSHSGKYGWFTSKINGMHELRLAISL
jgi:hypothetical protein